MPFKHGYIVSSLKIVRNNFADLSDHDAFAGLKRFKELFFTYFLYELIVVGVLFVLGFILVILTGAFGAYSLDVSSLLSLTALITLVFGGVSVLVGLACFAFPYLLEKYGYKGMAALKESIQFIKGHLFDLFKLEFSYLGWSLLVALVQIFVTEVFSFLGTLGVALASLASGAIALFTYLPQYYVSKAIFFEEIAYKRYFEYTQNQDESCEGEDKTQNDETKEADLNVIEEVVETQEQGEEDVQ